MKSLLLAAAVLTMTTLSTDAEAAPPPVEFTYLGTTSDGEATRFRIKVNATKAISQVDIHFRFLDDHGAELLDSDYAWQNVVKSKKLPIEAGKTYEVNDGLMIPGAVKIEAKLVRVIFADGSRWNAGGK